MRVRLVALFIFICVLAGGVSVRASVPDPLIYSPRLVGLPSISGAPYGTYQTAVRSSNTPVLQVFVHTASASVSLLADLSAFGLSSSATTSDNWAGYSALYYPAYFYNFSPLSFISVADGVHAVSLMATTSAGGVATATTSIIVDNVAPSISLSSITFGSDSPQKFDLIYLSGLVDGTGSAINIASVDQYPLGSSGAVLPYGYASDIASFNREALNSAFASSTDGTFTHVPIKLYWGNETLIASSTSLKIDLSAYDEAGFFATTTLTVTIPKPDPCIAEGTCVSNVLFLPGIEGSRLYEGEGTNCARSADEKLWEPVEVTFGGIWSAIRGAGDAKTKELFLDETGVSMCNTVYTKPGDIIDTAGGGDIYKSLITEMNGLKSDGTIKDWKPVAYDWRLSFDDLLSKGAERDGKIFYEEATSTPYIEQTLRALAASSKTGKVSVVAHSNGGLLAKALLNKLAGESSSFVDKVIMVGAPQSGAPEALGVTLVGHNAGIYKFGYPIVSNAVVRTLAENSPMAYHLLPSQNYFDSVMNDAVHPVARFAGDGYPKEEAAYGPVIGTLTELDDFLLARDGGREKPAASDVSSANILNTNLVTYANDTHSILDSWMPPAGIEVSQIAGWGADTIAGIDFYTLPKMSGALAALGPVRAYRPILTEDGDGTVPVPSALMMSTSTENVKRYWLDLANSSIKHGDIFENSDLRLFVKNLLKNNSSSLPSTVSVSTPITSNSKKLTFFLHSPLTLELTDSSGNVTGIGGDGTMIQNIPDSSYGEFGEVKYVTVPQGDTYQLSMHGQASGTFSLDIQESSGGTVTNTSTIANLPTTANTLASLSITDGIDTASPLTVDKNGDGNVFTITPKVGKTVDYVEPRRSHWGPSPVVIASSAPDEASTTTSATISPQTEILIEQSAATSTEATTTEPVATTTSEIATTTIAQVKQKIYTPIAIAKKAVLSPKPKETNREVSQTASVYDASQQPALKKLGEAVYTNLYRLWTGLRRIFSI